MENNFRVLILHHNKDMDGVFSGALSYIFFKTLSKKLFNVYLEFDVIGYDYGKDESIDLFLNIDIAKHYHYIQFIDVTPPEEWLTKIIETNIKVDIFDHHIICEQYKEKFEDFSEQTNITIYYDKLICGAKLFYNETLDGFWYNKLITYIKLSVFEKFDSYDVFMKLSNIGGGMSSINVDYINLVDSYDTWKWKNEFPNEPKALALNEFINQYDLKSITTIYKIREMLINLSVEQFNYYLEIGFNIINFKKKQSLLEKFQTKEINYKNNQITVVIINNHANSYSIDNINEYNKTKDDNPNNIKCIIFYNNIDFTNLVLNISTRQIDKMFDCNQFVKWLTDGNGGGHIAASGGSLSLNNFITKINS